MAEPSTPEFVEVDAGSADAQAAMTSFFSELAARFPTGFDSIGYLEPEAYNPPHGRFFLAMSGGDVLACGGLVWIDGQTAEVKRMWVNPAARGRGLASRLLAFLEQTAAATGRPIVRLDTNPVLVEAIAMYRKAGYRDIERYNDNPYAGAWFEKHVAGDPA